MTPATRSRVPPKLALTWAFPTLWNASPHKQQTPATTAKPPACSVRQAVRQHMGVVRFKVWDAGYEASVAALRDALGEKDFDAIWAEGAALSTEEAIAYARHGRSQRKRPTSG